MRHKILSFISLIVVILFAVGCGQTRKISEMSSGSFPVYSYTQTLTKNQLDSICVVEGINSDLSRWIKGSLKDFESGTTANQWIYITNKNGFVIYDLTQRENFYILNKRIQKNK